MLILFIIERTEEYKTEDKIILSSHNPEKMKYYRDIPWKFLFYLATFIGIPSFIFFGTYFINYAIIGFIFIIKLLFSWLSQKAQQNRQDIYYVITAIFPSLLLSGSFSYNLGSNIYHLDNKNTNYLNIDAIKKPIIKIYDQWTLINWDEKEFAWVHNSKNQIIFSPKNHYPFKGIFC